MDTRLDVNRNKSMSIDGEGVDPVVAGLYVMVAMSVGGWDMIEVEKKERDGGSCNTTSIRF